MADRAAELMDLRLTQADMLRIFGVSRSQFQVQIKICRYDQFEIKPRIGRTRFWSAKKVQAYLDGEGLSTPSRFKRSA